MTEAEFRQKVGITFDQIEKAFESVDPDVAECEQSLGSLTVTLADQSRCILSVQPSVRQIWLALAAKGTAVHFSLDPSSGSWMDDKGRGIELIAYLKSYFRDSHGLSLAIGG